MKLLIDFKNELKIISEKLELADFTLIFFLKKEKFCLIVYKIFQQIIRKQISNSIGKFILFFIQYGACLFIINYKERFHPNSKGTLMQI